MFNAALEGKTEHSRLCGRFRVGRRAGISKDHHIQRSIGLGKATSILHWLARVLQSAAKEVTTNSWEDTPELNQSSVHNANAHQQPNLQGLNAEGFQFRLKSKSAAFRW